MSVVVISEFASLTRDSELLIHALAAPAATQKVTIGAEAKSNAIASPLVRLAVQADSCIAFGVNPTAKALSDANPSCFFPAGSVEVRALNVGDKISVIAA